MVLAQHTEKRKREILPAIYERTTFNPELKERIVEATTSQLEKNCIALNQSLYEGIISNQRGSGMTALKGLADVAAELAAVTLAKQVGLEAEVGVAGYGALRVLWEHPAVKKFVGNASWSDPAKREEAYLDVIQAWADQAVDYAVNTLMVQDVENEIGAIPDLHTAAT